VTISAGSLTKTGSSGWNAGAASTASLAAGDGFVEFTATETNTTRACGLADQDASYDPAEIDFAIQLQDNADVRVYESGVLRGAFGTYAPGDRFRVEVRMTQVVYRKNGVVFYTSGVAPTLPLSADAALDTPGATLGEVRLGNLVWMNEAGVAVWGYGLLKTAGSGWGNSGAATTMELASGDGAVEYTATDRTTGRMLGLSNGDTNQSYTDIDYALSAGSGNLYVYEKGTLKGSFGAHAVGDRLRVAVEGGVVKYRRNGTLLYTSAQAIQYPLLVDAALDTSGVALTEIVLAGPFAAAPVAAPAFAPPGGTYTTPQSVTVTCGTPFAEIRYTTDGAEPGISSTLYTGPISVGTTTTLKAKAFRADLNPSATTAATYQMNFGTLAAPVLTPGSGVYPASQAFTLTAASGTTIRYTTDGTDPTTASPVYTAPLSFQATTTLKAKAFHPDYTASPTATATYNIKAATPVLSLPGGTYAPGTAVTVSDPDSGVTIRYTLNGVDPATTDTVIASGGSLFLGDFTLKVRAFKSGCDPSDVQAATYSLSGSLTAAAVAAGTAHTLLLKPDGTLYAWGGNSQGQLGDGTTTFRWSPTQVVTLTGVVSIAAGSGHSLAVRVDGTVWAWGDNNDGQLGDGTSTDRLLPNQVPGLAGATVVAAGSQHSLLRKSDASVWSWGGNSYGQLGIGTTSTSLIPVQVAGLQDVVAIAAGLWHSLARRADGTLVAWGRNDYRQLGDGTTTQRTAPVAVSLTGTVAAGPSAGQYNTLASTSDNVAWGWGTGWNDALCGASPTTPSAIAGLSVNEVAAGESFSVFRLLDGTLRACGANGAGSLGAGSAVAQSATPLVVVGLAGVEGMTAGQGHGLAITPGGVVWGWGRNDSGQVGDGTSINRRAPVKITEPGFQFKTATPVIGTATGTYTFAFNTPVSSSTPGATIHYTTNGNEPTEADPVVSGGSVAVSQSLTLKAKAFKPELAESNTDTAVYTLVVPAPGLSPGAGTYNTAQNVTVSCALSGTTLHYTTNGQDPTESDPVVACSGVVPVDQSLTLKAKGWKSGWTPSNAATAVYTMLVGSPSLSPVPGSYAGPQTVSLATVTPGATIRYTTNGLNPTPADPAGTSVLVDRSLTVKAYATRAGWTDSAVAVGSYALSLGTVATPSLSPAGGSYAAPQTVTLSCTTGGATIRYTLDGTDPTFYSPAYAQPIMVSTSTTVKARAFKLDWLASPVTSGTYSIGSGSAADPPILGPGSGRYANGLRVTITSPMAGTTIRYTTTGVDPTETDPVVASGATVLVDRSMRLKARAWKAGLEPSPIASADYEIVGAVAAGMYHSVALRADGTVASWGTNYSGQLGDGTTVQRMAPVDVLGLVDVIAVAAGQYNTVALKSDGTVWSWGSNNGTVGELGAGISDTYRTSPVQVIHSSGPLTGVVAIAAGEQHSLALKSDGTVWVWGFGYYGSLGLGNQDSQSRAVQVPGLAGVTAIVAGGWHSLALQTNGGTSGTLWAWGLNDQGQLLDQTTATRYSPIAVAEGVRLVAAGVSHTFVQKADGSLWGAGLNSYGQLGNGTLQTPQLTLAPALQGLAGVTKISASGVHTLALTDAGEVWATGYNNRGQLGDGTLVDKTSPIRVVLLDDAVDVAAGLFAHSIFYSTQPHSLALTADGRVWTWGANSHGALGSGLTINDDRYRPQPILGFSAADQSWPTGDPDGDGLLTQEELGIGTDPFNPDTNGDGLTDGAAARSGLSATSLDVDGDGVANAVERAAGTDPLRVDSDGDAVADGADCFPLDPTRSSCPQPQPGDVTPPVITLTEPPSAVLVSSVP
jgi:alpha-tubulin suppressor-like RCC1 family protein